MFEEPYPISYLALFDNKEERFFEVTGKENAKEIEVEAKLMISLHEDQNTPDSNITYFESSVHLKNLTTASLEVIKLGNVQYPIPNTTTHTTYIENFGGYAVAAMDMASVQLFREKYSNMVL